MLRGCLRVRPAVRHHDLPSRGAEHTPVPFAAVVVWQFRGAGRVPRRSWSARCRTGCAAEPYQPWPLQFFDDWPAVLRHRAPSRRQFPPKVRFGTSGAPRVGRWRNRWQPACLLRLTRHWPHAERAVPGHRAGLDRRSFNAPHLPHLPHAYRPGDYAGGHIASPVAPGRMRRVRHQGAYRVRAG